MVDRGTSSAADGILGAVANAVRLRRSRVAIRDLARVAPMAGAALLAAAVVVRLVGAPIGVFWIALVLAAGGLGAFVWMRSRPRPVTDAAASQVDTDASFGGELRSAHWFASRPDADAWTTFHLERAVERVAQVSWPAIYPPVRAGRRWLGAAVLVVGAIALASWTGRSLGLIPIIGSRGTGVAVKRGEAIPADLQKQIDDLLKSVANGDVPLDAARTKLSDLRDALASMDPKLKNALEGGRARTRAKTGKLGSAGSGSQGRRSCLARRASRHRQGST